MLSSTRRWLLGQPLSRKLTASVLLTSSVTLAIACAVFAVYDFSSSRVRLVRDVTTLADVVGSNSTAALMFNDAQAAMDTLRAVSVGGHINGAQLFARDGAMVASYSRAGQPGAAWSFDRTLLLDPQPQAIFDGSRLLVLRPVTLNHDVLGSIAVESDVGEIWARLANFGAIVVVVIVGTFWIALGLSRATAKVIYAPVERLVEVTRTVRDAGRYDVRAERTSQDEFGELIEHFNDMLSQVQRRDQQLLLQQEDLERTVDARTAELRTANRDLVTARDKAMEASRAKSEFLANMSHEIRTPMNGVIGMTELVLDSELTDDQRDCLTTVRTSADTLLTILNDILDFSKIESRKLELEAIPFSVRDIVSDMLRPFALRAEQKGLELIADIHPDVPGAVVGDPVRFQQILANLVGNAIKFTDRGHVAVHIREEARAEPRTRLHVRVSDTGIGIPADKIGTIFEAFRQADGSTTRKFGGTGLGLTISATLVRMMGGRLWVESEPDAGTTFHFTLACDIAESLEPAHATHGAANVRALVVDDNPVNRRLLIEQLTRWQIPAVAVDGGRPAIDALLRAAEAGKPINLVLLDANMPDLDGFAVAEAIQQHGELPAATVMMLTSSGQYGDQSRCRELGIAAYLHKPIRPLELRNAIDRALGAPARDSNGAPSERIANRALEAVRVLLVEDNAVNQRVATGLLTRRGHVVTLARDGREALDLVGRESFDVVRMDLQMPVMGGFESTAAIRERERAAGGHVRIVAMTAHAMTGDRERCLAAGMDGYLSKPVDPRMLFAVVEQAPAEAPLAAAALTENAMFDEAELRARVAGDDQLMVEVIRLFLDDCPARLADIEAAVARRNADEVRATAHALKGAAGNLAATGLFEAARVLERLGAESRIDAFDAGWRRLSAEAVNAMDALRRFESAKAATCVS
jgi:two-component system, sensor histidine kinase and response regulator